MIASNVTGFGVSSVPAAIPNVIEMKTPTLQSEQAEIQIKSVEQTDDDLTIEEYVRNYFSDIPVMIEIAKCESRFRQSDEEGNVLRGEQNTLDRGVMQINEFYHNENSEKLGYDIMTLKGNTSYARALFEKYGVKPWSSSYKCWGKTTAYAEYKKQKDLAVK